MEKLLDKLKTYIEAYRQPPYGREVDGTVELLQEVLEKFTSYYNLEKQVIEETYTLDQIVEAITQADDELICAIQYKDREGVEDVLRDYLH